MPTPFAHLSLLISLLNTSGEWFTTEIAELLAEQRGPFLLGGTAPDVRNISPITRHETHFYPIPPDPSRPSMQTMLQTWPQLADPSKLEPDHAAFIAGYLAHLWFDEYWYDQVITPYFFERNEWGDQRFRFDTYNLLIGYLDSVEKNKLDADTGQILQNTTPHNWMPFLSDEELDKWKAYISSQLLNGSTRTVEILAGRARMAPIDYTKVISDRAEMEKNVFNRAPRTVIVQVLTGARRGSAQIIMRYLGQDN
ncbi:MAG: hypothetical protein JXA42_08950 [Anaerolineales bacterium]|nr:hypothetical protein [Anaerolineales bacterium]